MAMNRWQSPLTPLMSTNIALIGNLERAIGAPQLVHLWPAQV
jgi:hypothetical protein